MPDRPRPKEKKDKIDGLMVAAHISHALLLFGGLITGIILPVIGLIVAYVSRIDARGTWLESHFTWQIVTFWFGVGLGLTVLLFLAMVRQSGAGLMIVSLIGLGCAVWLVFRYVKGWVRLGRNMAVD